MCLQYARLQPENEANGDWRMCQNFVCLSLSKVRDFIDLVTNPTLTRTLKSLSECGGNGQSLRPWGNSTFNILYRRLWLTTLRADSEAGAACVMVMASTFGHSSFPNYGPTFNPNLRIPIHLRAERATDNKDDRYFVFGIFARIGSLVGRAATIPNHV